MESWEVMFGGTIRFSGELSIVGMMLGFNQESWCLIHNWLVVWNMFYDFSIIYGNVIIPTDVHIFQDA
jgi:hypothetical protein